MEQSALQAKLDQFFQQVKKQLSSKEVELIEKAAACAAELHKDQKRASGEPYFIHPLEVASILLTMQLDGTTIAAAFLHDTLEDTSLSRQDLRERFGKEVEALVNGVTKIEAVKSPNKNAAEAETIRKMLFAMVKDIRVILIKLADRLHNMRTLQYKTVQRQKAIAQDTLDIYAPLAAQLGISWMKDELEDLSLKFLQPEVYQQIKLYLSQKKDQRSQYLERVAKDIEDLARKENIKVQVNTRAKHFYSIYKKMKERDKNLDEIFDFLGIRILCETVSDCYVLLGLVHSLWKPIDGRFKDYIAMPKSNRYQSLHTTVMCYDGKLTEIQIRTIQMEETAAYGVAAHWFYKKQTKGASVNQDDITIINKLKALDKVPIASMEFLDEIKRDLLQDSIYVFTPQGDVIQLPAGSTPIDFAYHIHTEVGNHAVTAKADGVIIPLKSELKNTQVIEIITNPSGRPRLDWLRVVKTSRTRHKIRSWINHHDDSVFIDRNIVARKNPLLEKNEKNQESKKDQAQETKTTGPSVERTPIKVGNESNMMIRFANCCNPVIGDDIIGYVSRGRGIIVHKHNCSNLGNIPDLLERTLPVEWESVAPNKEYRVLIKAKNLDNLFADVDNLIKRHKGHLVSGSVDDSNPDFRTGTFTLEVPRTEDIKKILREIKGLKAVNNAELIHLDTRVWLD